MELSEATSHGATLREAKLVLSRLLDESRVDAIFCADDKTAFALIRETGFNETCVESVAGDSLLRFLEPFCANESSSLDGYDEIEVISLVCCFVLSEVWHLLDDLRQIFVQGFRYRNLIDKRAQTIHDGSGHGECSSSLTLVGK